MHDEMRGGGQETRHSADADRLRRWRAERKVGVAELAEYLGVTRQTVWDWEAGKREVPGPARLALRHYDCENPRAAV